MSARVLVVGVGNLFLGDDGFGVEVARRLLEAPVPDGVKVADFGIRGVHLAFELLDPPQLLIAVDAVSRGGAPGTLYVIDPELEAVPEMQADAHGMSLVAVFGQVRAMGGRLPPIRIIGCDVEDVSERMGLSDAVAQAVPEAMALVRELWTQVPAAGGHAKEVAP